MVIQHKHHFLFPCKQVVDDDGKVDVGDNNDVVELEKLQVEMGLLGRIRAGDINVG